MDNPATPICNEHNTINTEPQIDTDIFARFAEFCVFRSNLTFHTKQVTLENIKKEGIGTGGSYMLSEKVNSVGV